NSDSGTSLAGLFIDRENSRTEAIGALPAGPYESPVEHARQSDVLDVHVFAADFVGDVEPRNPRADDFVFRARFGRRVVRVLPRQLDPACVAHRLVSPVERFITEQR